MIYSFVIFSQTILNYILSNWVRLTFKKENGTTNGNIVVSSKKSSNTFDQSVPEKSNIVPESVNYHFTRTCNYSCGFCFHTAKTSFNLPLEEAKRGLEMLVKEGMKKVFSMIFSY